MGSLAAYRARQEPGELAIAACADQLGGRLSVGVGGKALISSRLSWRWSGCCAGLSSRRYAHGLEPAGKAVESAAAATTKSAVSRRFVAATETALAELMSKRLDDLDLVAFMVDGVHFGEHTCVVALGIGIDGTKHPLGVEEGSTENATVVTDLITGLRERGLDVTRPILAVLDGAKALSKAVKDVFDKPLIQRCQQHKIRNVRDKLPETAPRR